MGSSASGSCRGDGDTLLYPPTPTHMRPPDGPAAEGVRVHVPFPVTGSDWPVPWPPCDDEANSLGWEMDWTPPRLSPCFSFFFFCKESGGGGMEMGSGLGGGFSNISLL